MISGLEITNGLDGCLREVYWLYGHRATRMSTRPNAVRDTPGAAYRRHPQVARRTGNEDRSHDPRRQHPGPQSVEVALLRRVPHGRRLLKVVNARARLHSGAALHQRWLRPKNQRGRHCSRHLTPQRFSPFRSGDAAADEWRLIKRPSNRAARDVRPTRSSTRPANALRELDGCRPVLRKPWSVSSVSDRFVKTARISATKPQRRRGSLGRFGEP